MIFSRGVEWHFRGPGPIFRRSFELLEPGGVKVTVIPNTWGLYGRLRASTIGRLILKFENFALRLWGSSVLSAIRFQLSAPDGA